MSETKKSIVFAGGIFRDLVAYTERFPKVGETIFGSKFQMGFGGKAANQAVMCSRLGGQSIMLGMVGDDDHGKAYTENFKASHVDATYLGVVNGVSSGVAAIYVETTSGNNEIIIVPGANNYLTPEMVEKSESAFPASDLVVVGLEVSHDAIIKVLELAKKHGVRTLTNAAPASQSLDPKIFQLTDILCVNETEAEIIAGRSDPIETDDDIKDVCEKLLQKCPTIIVTMGGRGSVLATRAEPEPVAIPADAVERVVDTTGAGDAFVGALAFYLCHFPDLTLSELIRRSGSIASISVQGEGTQTSFPFKKDLPDHFFKSS